MNNKKSSSKLTKWRQVQAQRKKTSTSARYHPIAQVPQTMQLQKKRLLRKTVPLLLFFFITGLISFYLSSPQSRLEQVKVTGCDYQTRKEIIQQSGLKYYSSIPLLKINEEKLIQKLKHKIPSLKAVNFNFKGNRLTIEVKEYATIAYFEKNNQYYRITQSGLMNQTGTSKMTGVYPVIIGDCKKSQLKQLSKQLAEIDSKIENCISEIHFTPTKVDPDKLHLYMNDGNEVLAQISTLAKKMNYYPQYTAKMNFKGIIDLEVGAYAYPKN